MKQASLSPFALAATLLGLFSACTEPQAEELIDGCVGALRVTLPLTTVPAKVKVEYRHGDRTELVVADECTSSLSTLVIERPAGALLVDDGGFGYTPPATFDLKVLDRDCSGTRADITLVDVKAHPVAGLHGSCSHAEVTLPAR
ncbi:MAG TPA: hypothetical protein PKU97_05315 [Kofleriaceae bacterium]|nr:hypothetical protein [Kofleriaceae bacterium]